jgi:uncharacterized membrane protein YagU involved in acid resistance
MHRLRTILIATAVAGSLDLLSAFLFAGLAGVTAPEVLRFVASGPFGDTMLAVGVGSELVGLVIHYALMLIMAATFVRVADRLPTLLRHPVRYGLLYGLLLWVVMYWIVRPARWPAMPLPHTAWDIANQLFSHCILVGLPIALIAARRRRV